MSDSTSAKPFDAVKLIDLFVAKQNEYSQLSKSTDNPYNICYYSAVQTSMSEIISVIIKYLGEENETDV